MFRSLLFGLLFCAYSGPTFAATLIGGDSIGPDSAYTDHNGGPLAVQAGNR